MYAEAQNAQQAGRPARERKAQGRPASESKKADENVVDAEFTEVKDKK